MTALFEVDATLDQYSAARRGGEPADDRHRCGNYQRARAGNHQQHQGFVYPVVPRHAECKWWNDCHQHRQHEHGWRINAGEFIHEALRRRTLALRCLDGTSDAIQRSFALGRRDAKLKHPAFVERACKQACTDGFFHRQTLTGNRRLVDAGTSRNHDAIQRDSLARTDAHDLADSDLVRRLLRPNAIGQLHKGSFRRIGHQGANRVTGTVET